MAWPRPTSLPAQTGSRPKLIEAKARDILRRYVENILPNGLNAQMAYSRLAAIRYTGALAEARDELVAEAEALEPKLGTWTIPPWSPSRARRAPPFAPGAAW